MTDAGVSGQTSPEWPPPERPAQAPPPKAKKTGLVVVSILAVLFLAAAGAFGGLYLAEKSDHEKVATQLTTANKTLADKEKILDSALQEAKTANSGYTTEQAKAFALGACHDAVVALRAALVANQDDATINNVLGQAFDACP